MHSAHDTISFRFYSIEETAKINFSPTAHLWILLAIFKYMTFTIIPRICLTRCLETFFLVLWI